MTGEIVKVALAGKGRIGTPVAAALVKAGFQTTILTRSASSIKDVPTGAEVVEVDYDSASSLKSALAGQDALVSTVAMSGITNQKLMIDCAIEAGVKHFIPAEYTLSTRDPKAQWLPLYATVLDIERYLEGKGDRIAWTAVNCGGLMEFVFDVPFVLDFEGQRAVLYDGGENECSLSTAAEVAKAVAGVLKNPERVRNHGVKVHGGLLSQKQALEIAKKYSSKPWTSESRSAKEEIEECMAKLGQGVEGAEQLDALLRVMSAATFGDEHFDAAYRAPDNDWLGIELWDDSVIEDAIRRRVLEGPYSVQSATAGQEGMSDVAAGLVKKHGERS